MDHQLSLKDHITYIGGKFTLDYEWFSPCLTTVPVSQTAAVLVAKNALKS